MVLASPSGIVDLLRVERIDDGRLVVAADSDPGFSAALLAEELLGRELDEAGAAAEHWIGGHVLVRRKESSA